MESVARRKTLDPTEAGDAVSWILAGDLSKHGAFEFVLAEETRCPICRAGISAKTLVEPQSGVEVDSVASK
jgi:hypothetical protein